MLTPLQLACFETFGYLHLPGAIAADYAWISDEFDAAWRARGNVGHDGSRRTSFPINMIQATRRLTTLLDHPVVTGCADALLGDGWTFYGGDGNLYSGDTGWHSDVWPEHWEPKTVCRHLKIAFYLDALTPATGSLRVIPGSHHRGDRFADVLEQGALRDLAGPQVPAVALTQQPGDLVVFDHRIKHAAFGGGPNRRMFTMNLHQACRTSAQRDAALTVYRYYRDREAVVWTWDETWLASLTPGERRRMDLCIDLGDQVREEKRAQPALA